MNKSKTHHSDCNITFSIPIMCIALVFNKINLELQHYEIHYTVMYVMAVWELLNHKTIHDSARRIGMRKT